MTVVLQKGGTGSSVRRGRICQPPVPPYRDVEPSILSGLMVGNICNFKTIICFIIAESAIQLYCRKIIYNFKFCIIYPLGTLPHITEGEVNRKACISTMESCCYLALDIKVKNCGNYRVYDLKKTPGCQMGYCFGK